MKNQNDGEYLKNVGIMYIFWWEKNYTTSFMMSHNKIGPIWDFMVIFSPTRLPIITCLNIGWGFLKIVS